MKPLSREQVVRTYRLYARFYDRMFGSVLEPGRQALLEAVCALGPDSVLEVGVGTGLTLDGYPSSAALVGVDVSAEMLEKARIRAEALKDRNIQLAPMDAEAMDFPDGSFDCVTLPYVLSVTPNPQRLVAETRRVCRKGGMIFVLNHFSGGCVWWCFERALRSRAGRIGFRSDFSFEEHILAHDWEILSMKKVNLFGLSRLIAIRNS